MDIDILGTYTTGTEADIINNGLGLGLWELFQPIQVLDLRSFTYDNKNGRIVQERVKKMLMMEVDPISVVT
jgi:hypothetical protein